jgi:hypothetical protein
LTDLLSPIESALDDEGLYWVRDDDEDAFRVSFKSEGERYFVIAYRDDPNFLMIGSGWALPAGIEVARALDVANLLNVRKKFVKTALWEEEHDVLFTVELCVNSADEVCDHFGRLLEVLRDTALEFFEVIREEA